jgi:hypothetical protein
MNKLGMNKLGMNKLGMSKVRLSELTGGEAREVLARRPVILLPLGSQEDQGPHAPMGDYLSADAVAARIAAAATAAGTETLVAPVLPFGGADYFGTMPGGIALGQATLRAVLTDIFGSAGPGHAARGADGHFWLPAAPRPRPVDRDQRAWRQRAGHP